MIYKMKIESTLVRIYVSLDEIEKTISFYETLTSERAVNRFKYKEEGLEIVRVGGFLIIAGNSKVLEKFRKTSATIKVDNLEEFKDFIIASGGRIVNNIKEVPTGRNMTICHRDGTIIEYVQHDKNNITEVNDFDKFLSEDEYVNYSNDSVKKLAQKLSGKETDKVKITKKIYEYVRDQIPHSFDIDSKNIAAKASDVIKMNNGVCHAKAVLFTALLRYLKIPAGFCFQHLAMGDNAEYGYCLHGYNAVYLNGKWVKLDASGSRRGGKNAEFSLEEPVLPYKNRVHLDEYFIEGIYSKPDIKTMQMLERANDVNYIIKNIPDKLSIKTDIK